jgi:hypothetical protein
MTNDIPSISTMSFRSHHGGRVAELVVAFLTNPTPTAPPSIPIMMTSSTPRKHNDNNNDDDNLAFMYKWICFTGVELSSVGVGAASQTSIIFHHHHGSSSNSQEWCGSWKRRSSRSSGCRTGAVLRKWCNVLALKIDACVRLVQDRTRSILLLRRQKRTIIPTCMRSIGGIEL